MYLYIVVMMIGVIGVFVCKRKKCHELQKSFWACIGVAVLAIAVDVTERDNVFSGEEDYLVRQPAGAGDYEVQLTLKADGMEEQSFQINVPEQLLTKEEEEAYLEAALNEIEAEFKGENTSLEKIQNRLVIKDVYQDGLVSAEWSFSNPELISEDGEIKEEALNEEGEVVCVTVTLSCGESKLLHSLYCKVFCKDKSEEEKLSEKIYAIILEDGKKAGTEILQLPKEVEARTLSWERKESRIPQQILILGILVAALLPELEREKRRESKKKREEQLLHEYPEMVNKLTLLLGAGMTVQGAWNKITDMYLAARKEGKISRNEVYEEMLITRHEIESGRGEIRSYEAFGERCGLPRFRKFTNYLVQNIKKGSLGICELLEKEVTEVFAEKRNRARRYGEEATTKLLFPMLFMLGIVIFIIMVPAVTSFQMGT